MPRPERRPLLPDQPDGASARRGRVMIVTRDRFPPDRVDLTELVGRWLTPYFDIVWVMRGGGEEGCVAPYAGEAFRVSGPGLWCWIRLQLGAAAEVARGGVDLVQVRDAALSALLFRLAAWAGRRPFVYWMSFPMAEDYRHRAWRRTPRGAPWLALARFGYGALAGFVLYRLVLPSADHVVAQSERMKADVLAKAAGVKGARILAVPMGVSTDRFNPETVAPAGDPRLQGRRVLAYLGALDPERRIEVLIDALSRLAGDRLLVLIGGSGADRARLSAAARRAGVVERVVFTSVLPLADALTYVRRADVCLAPFPVQPAHYRSATPTKLVEYLAMGRPVAASDHPDQRRVLEDSGAGVLAPFTAEGFAAAIEGLLAAPEAAEAMGARGPAWVRAHRDYADLHRGVAALYDRLIRDALIRDMLIRGRGR